VLDTEITKGADLLHSQKFDEAFSVFFATLKQAQDVGDKQVYNINEVSLSTP
jgi:hypothetical protein